MRRFKPKDPHGDPASGAPLSERAARALGVALAVAAHSPPAIDLLATLRAEGGPRVAQGWNGGGCHVFAVALVKWLREGERRGSALRSYVDLGSPKLALRVEEIPREERTGCFPPERPRMRVIARPAPERPHMIHVVVWWRGWYFDDRGAWSERELRHAYDRYGIVDYVPHHWRREPLARDPKDADALAEILFLALRSWRDWAPPPCESLDRAGLHQGFFYPGEGLLFDVSRSYNARHEALRARRRKGKTRKRPRMTRKMIAAAEAREGMGPWVGPGAGRLARRRRS